MQGKVEWMQFFGCLLLCCFSCHCLFLTKKTFPLVIVLASNRKEKGAESNKSLWFLSSLFGKYSLPNLWRLGPMYIKEELIESIPRNPDFFLTDKSVFHLPLQATSIVSHAISKRPIKATVLCIPGIPVLYRYTQCGMNVWYYVKATFSKIMNPWWNLRS